jgi:hypothetical protein
VQCKIGAIIARALFCVNWWTLYSRRTLVAATSPGTKPLPPPRVAGTRPSHQHLCCSSRDRRLDRETLGEQSPRFGPTHSSWRLAASAAWRITIRRRLPHTREGLSSPGRGGMPSCPTRGDRPEAKVGPFRPQFKPGNLSLLEPL